MHRVFQEEQNRYDLADILNVFKQTYRGEERGCIAHCPVRSSGTAINACQTSPARPQPGERETHPGFSLSSSNLKNVSYWKRQRLYTEHTASCLPPRQRANKQTHSGSNYYLIAEPGYGKRRGLPLH